MLKKTKKNLKKAVEIMRFALPLWHLYVAVSLLALFAQMFGIAQPWLMKFFLDDVLVNGRFDLMLPVIGGFLAINIFSGLFGMLNNLVTTKLFQKQQLLIQLKVYEHLERLQLKFFHKKKVGDLLTRIEYDALEIQSFIMTIINTFIVNLFYFIVILYISLQLNSWVTLLSLSVFPVYFLSEYLWVKKLKKYAQRLRTKDAANFSFLEESLGAIKSIKIFAREKELSDEYKKRMEKINRLNYKSVRLGDIAGLMNSFILYLPTLVVFLVGGHQVLLGALTVGGLVALQQYVMRLFGPVANFVNVNRTLQFQMVNINRVLEILKSRPEDKDKPGSRDLQNVRGFIEFKNVQFGYDKKRHLLKNINEKIYAGRHIGLVGSSGVGKSTLVNLLLRFYRPKTGKILLDGIDIDDIKLNSLRSKIGFVSQEAAIFHQSIKDNIAFGKPGASINEVIAAAKVAQIHDYISTLPKKYETIAGEHGATLSAGEKQRISIARVVLKNPDIVVLDEPTTYLDSSVEKSIKNAIDTVTKGKTTIIIAHRLTTLQNIDEIWVLANGRIAEKGTFEDLVKKKGRFFSYYITQFSGFEMFRNRLNIELERAIKYEKPLSILELDIHNWSSFDKDQLSGNDLISKILIALTRRLNDINFPSDIPQKRGSFFIALPESREKEAKKIGDSLLSFLSRTFPDIVFKQKIVFASSFKPETGKNNSAQIVRNLLK